LRPGGTLYALANYGGIAPARFRARLDEVLKAEGRRPASFARLALPEDFDEARPPAEAGDGPRVGKGAAVEGTLIGFAVRVG
jgi:hypothetical protein